MRRRCLARQAPEGAGLNVSALGRGGLVVLGV